MKYDEGRVLLFLREKEVKGYVNDTSMSTDEKSEPQDGFTYTGTESDGGTLVETKTTCRDGLIDAIIRSEYSESQEDAIKTHKLMILDMDDNDPQKESYQAEWQQFCDWQKYAKSTVDSWLGK